MRATNPTVLLVEDDPTTREFYRAILAGAGFRVRQAADGLQAIGMFQVHAVDAIVTDIVMPRLDGLSAIGILRGAQSGQQVPIIVVTALTDLESAQSARQAGAAEVLVKPIAPHQLVEALHRHLSPDPAARDRLQRLLEVTMIDHRQGERRQGERRHGERRRWDRSVTYYIQGRASSDRRHGERRQGERRRATGAGREINDAAMKKKILVVDDDRDLVQMLQLALRLNEYEVIPAHSGHEALERVAAAQPDLIILDVMMPGMDGFEVLGQLKENAVTAGIPVVMLTAVDAGAPKGWGMGADFYWTKPFKVEELVALVQLIFEQFESGKPQRHVEDE